MIVLEYFFNFYKYCFLNAFMLLIYYQNFGVLLYEIRQ